METVHPLSIWRNAMYLEKDTIKVLAHAQDIETTDLTTDKIKFDENFNKVAVALLVSGADDTDLKVELKQYAGATSKEVPVIKQSFAKLGNAKVFSAITPVQVQVEQAVEGGEEGETELVDVPGLFELPVGANNGVIVLHVDAHDLDVNAGFIEFELKVHKGVEKVVSVLAMTEPMQKPALSVAF